MTCVRDKLEENKKCVSRIVHRQVVCAVSVFAASLCLHAFALRNKLDQTV